MDTDQLRADLRQAARRAPTPPADLAHTVLGRRRGIRRQRAALLGATLAVALIVAAVPLGLSAVQDRSSNQVAAGEPAIHSLPPRGSLAGDPDFLAGVQRLPWTYDEDHTDVNGSLHEAGGDLAAAIPAAGRHVVFAGDVPGGRWALMATRTTGGYAAAWFTGPTDAEPGEMVMSGPAQLVTDGQPVAHVDQANPDKPLVVVAAPGDHIRLSPAATVDASGQLHREYRPVEAVDGVAITRLRTPLRYGLAASVEVERDGRSVFRARPTTAGDVAGMPAVDASGWGWVDGDPETPQILADRTGTSLSTSRALTDTMLGSLLGPTGLTLRDIATSGSQITELYSGDRFGPATPDDLDRAHVQPVLTIWDIELPSGAHGLLAGWATVTDEDARTHQQTLLRIRPATFDAARDLVATPMRLPAAAGRPAEDVLVLAGPPDATRAEILDSSGAVLLTTDLSTGAGAVPTPAGAAAVRMTGQDRRQVARGVIDTGVDRATFGDYGDNIPTWLTTIPSRDLTPPPSSPATPSVPGGAPTATAPDATGSHSSAPTAEGVDGGAGDPGPVPSPMGTPPPTQPAPTPQSSDQAADEHP